ncbi:MAG TPA: hypothetical protein VFS88_08465, partial [Micavibrio sp.]|nr:hypothetical protein [Micavibrio sp.]
GKKLTLPSFYKKRIADLKSGTVDANLWDAAGTFMGYNYIRNYALGSIIFLLTPLIFGLLFIFPGLVGTLAVLIIVGAAQWFLIPAVLILWIFIFGDKK